MPVLSDEDVGLSPSYLSDEDVGLGEEQLGEPGGERATESELQAWEAPPKPARGFWGSMGHEFKAVPEAAGRGAGLLPLPGPGGWAPSVPDERLREHLESEFAKSQNQEPPTTAGKVGGMIGGLGGSLAQYIGTTAVAGPAGPVAAFASGGAYNSFMSAGQRALAEGKSIDDALVIAKGAAGVGALTEGALGAIPGGNVIKTAIVSGLTMGGAKTVSNLAERELGLQTPIMEGVGEATLLGGTVPVAGHATVRGIGAVGQRFTPPERGGIPEPVRQTTGEPNAPTATNPARQQLDATAAPTRPEAVLQADAQKASEAQTQKGNAPQDTGLLLDKSKWTKATSEQRAKISAEVEKQGESPADWQSFQTTDAAGFQAADVPKMRESLKAGKLTSGNLELDALLSHLLEPREEHPLDSIRMMDMSPEQAQQLAALDPSMYQRQYEALFSAVPNTRRAWVDMNMRRNRGETISQKAFIENLTHELFHNSVSSKMKDSPQLEREVTTLFEQAKAAAEGQPIGKHYGFTDAHEFISEISNPEFRKFLNSVKAGDGKTLWNKIVDVMRRALGLGDKMKDAFGREVKSGSVIEKALELSSKLEKTRRTEFTKEAPRQAKAEEETLPPVPEGHVRMFHGEGGPQGGGKGGSFYTSSAEKAATFGPDVSWVDVPVEKAQAAREAARKSGQGGDTALLTKEDASGAKPIAGKAEAKVYDLDEPAGDFKSAIKDTEKVTNEELLGRKGGATGFMWELGAKAKTAEDVAALKTMAEEAAKETKALMEAGKFEEAMAVAGRQPAEAYEFATGVKISGEPKWPTFEKRSPGYVPPVPDAKYLAAKGETPITNQLLKKDKLVVGEARPAQAQAIKESLTTEPATIVEEPPPTRPAEAPPPPPSKTTTTSAPAAEPESVSSKTELSQKWTGATEEAPKTDARGETLGGQTYAGIPNPAAVYRGIQKAVKDFGPGVKAAGKVVSDATKAIYRENLSIRKMNDLDRSVLGWSAKMQRSFGEAMSAQKDIQSVAKKKVNDEALSNWMEAGGDKAKLTQWRDGTTDPKAKAGYEAALNLSPEEVAMAQDARKAYNQLFDRAERWGLVDKDPTKPSSFRDDYVTHIWNLGKGAFAGGARTLKDQFKFAKARTFQNYFEGEQAGFKPKTKRLSQILPVYLHEMNSVIAAKQLVKQMWGGKASDGSLLLATRGNATPVSGAKGEAVLVRPEAPSPDSAKKGLDISKYKELPGQPALHDWVFAGKDTAGNPVFEKSDLVLHPEAYKKLKAILGKSKIREWYESEGSATMAVPKGIAKGLDLYQQETKRTMFGLFAPFHQVQEAWHGVGHRILPTPVTGGQSTKAGALKLPKPDMDNPEIYDMAKNGLMIFPDRASEAHFMDGMRHSGLVSHIPWVGKAADGYSKYLFHEVIPGLKIKTYAAALERNKGVYEKDLASGEVNLEDVKLLTATQVNAAYGHLNYADFGRDPTIQHILQLGLLAPDFLEARMRFFGQGLKGLVPELGAKGERVSGARGNKVGREQLYALATLAAAQALLAYTGSKLTDGEWDGKHPFEFRKGNRKYTLRSVPEDMQRLWEDIRNVFRGGGEIPFIHHRLNPVTGRGPLQLLTGRDWRQQKITPQETAKQLALAPIPLTARSFMGIDKSPLEDWEQLAGAAGLKIMNYSPQSEVHKMLLDFKKESGNPKLVAQAEQAEAQTFAPSAYSDLRQAMERDNFQLGAKAYEKLMETHSAKEIRRAMNPESVDPDTGVHRDRMLPKALESQFLGSLKDEEREVYEAAKRQRRLLYQRFQRMLSE